MTNPFVMAAVFGAAMAVYLYFMYTPQQQGFNSNNARSNNQRRYRKNWRPAEYNDECVICSDLLSQNDTISLKCNHVFHKVCIDNMRSYARNSQVRLLCPLCRTSFE